MTRCDRPDQARSGYSRHEARRKQVSLWTSLSCFFSPREWQPIVLQKSSDKMLLEVLNLGAPSPPTAGSGGALLPSQKSHAGRLTHVYGQLPNGAYLVNACAAIESAPEVTLELWVDLDFFGFLARSKTPFRISLGQKQIPQWSNRQLGMPSTIFHPGRLSAPISRLSKSLVRKWIHLESCLHKSCPHPGSARG